MGTSAILNNLNQAIARTPFGRFFRLEGSGHPKEIKGAKFSVELTAGFTTFMTMCYIIAVNASIISQTGGTCVCNGSKDDPSCNSNVEYALCVQGIQRDLVTATAAIAALSSFIFGLFTNMPICLAPGMGLNAYFTYQVVGFHGTGTVPYRLALTAVFVEGLVFVFLALTGMRQWLVKMIPASLRIASTSGIGLFLAMIGLSTNGGIGLITGSSDHPTDLGGCPAEYLNSFGACTSHKMLNSTVWIGICCGGFVSGILMMYKVRGSIFYGIAVVSIMSWPRDTSFTYFPRTTAGDDRFDYFKSVVGFHAIKDTLVAQDWTLSGSTAGQFALALFTFLYVDILDATGTMYSMARFAGVVDPNDGSFPRSTIAYCTDAVCISIGSLFGVSPVTAFVESGAGIAEGGCTGLTAMTTGLFFFASLFFGPIFSNIPPWATGCALVLIGCLMLRSMIDVNWAYAGDALPAAVTLMLIPYTYSVAYGLIGGAMTYVVLNGVAGLLKFASRGRVIPADYDDKEHWSCKLRGKNIPWYMRISKESYHSFWYESNKGKDSQDEDGKSSVYSTELTKQSSSRSDIESAGGNGKDAPVPQAQHLTILTYLSQVLSLGQYATEYIALHFGQGESTAALVTSDNLDSLNATNRAGVILFFLTLYASKLSAYTRWVATTTLDFASETIILLLPIDMIWSLQMAVKSKLIVLGRFWFRIPVLVLAIGRFIYLHNLLSTTDVGVASNLTTILQEVEMTASLSATFILTLRPFAKEFDTGFGAGRETFAAYGYSNSNNNTLNSNGSTVGSTGRGIASRFRFSSRKDSALPSRKDSGGVLSAIRNRGEIVSPVTPVEYEDRELPADW
ncbi:hypothetical protein DV736_g1468, partial [Chaetothyriales sp. CBS 134916]